MRKIERTNKFKRDFKRELKGRHKADLETTWIDILKKLASNQPLAEKYYDHALTGDWKDYRNCHIKPNLVLIYRKPDSKRLQLVRLGSHSELGM